MELQFDPLGQFGRNPPMIHRLVWYDQVLSPLMRPSSRRLSTTRIARTILAMNR